ncbi:MAG: hypothetical protein M1832_003856 [Thelocarpon impressellum]|nr:MAG: hypothetical protein M1832_003856 [Thelocarpon impressellum]
MPREAEPSSNEKAFVLEALRENVRLDGRSFDDFRAVDLSFGEEFGVANVSLGKTKVMARISAEVTKPFPDRHFDGIFTITAELSPMASPAFEVGRQTEQEVLLSRLLEKAIRRANALDTESLCIVAGQKCWSVRADIHVLDHDGGLVDASCLAVLAALHHFRIPDVQVHGDGRVTVYPPAERVPVPLSILHAPLCVTFSLFPSLPPPSITPSTASSASAMLVDATHLESTLSGSTLIISANRHGELCQLAKHGGAPVDAVTLLRLVDVALRKVRALDALLVRRLAEDAKARDAGGVGAELRAENER